MARGYRAGSAVSRRAVFGVPALAEAVGATFAHGATELVENRPSKRGLSGADAITSLTSVDPGAPLTLTAACTLEDNDDSSGTSIVGSVTDAGVAVVVTIGDSDWQSATDRTALDLQAGTTIAAPTEPGGYTFAVICTTAGGIVYSASTAFEVIAPPPPPSTSTTTTTSAPTTTTSTSTTTTTSTIPTSAPVGQTMTELSSSANPSTLGQPVTFTAMIAPSAGSARF